MKLEDLIYRLHRFFIERESGPSSQSRIATTIDYKVEVTGIRAKNIKGQLKLFIFVVILLLLGQDITHCLSLHEHNFRF